MARYLNPKRAIAAIKEGHADHLEREADGVEIILDWHPPSLLKIPDRGKRDMGALGKVFLAPVQPRTGGTALFGCYHARGVA